ncbi:kappa-type opioid receptor-like [Amphiura filiformis]|uniref:kappa-type opioid receptor-like n=1 Tax=Amphiura filiformis TaxID=82378 RepID=UPI003B20DC2E
MAFNNNTDAASCLNFTLPEAEAHTYTPVKLVLIKVFIPAIACVGLLLNTTFLFVIYRIENMRTTTNFYLGNLAVADILTVVTGCFHHLGKYIASEPVDYPYTTDFKSRVACGAPYLVHYLSLFASVAFVFLVALERYRAICKPVVHRKTSSRRRTLKLAVVAWMILIFFTVIHSGSFEFIGLCLSWPQDRQFSGFPTVITICKWHKWANISIYTFAVCQFTVAFAGNVVMFIKIVHTLSNNNKGKVVKARNHVARMLSINAVVFFACLAPTHIIYAGIAVQKITGVANDDPRVYDDIIARDLFRNLYWASVCLTFINSAINPLIYNGSNAEYRRAFREAFCCSGCQNSRSIKGIEISKLQSVSLVENQKEKRDFQTDEDISQ